MGVIKRDIAAASREQFDLIVIGGGIHGVMLALEASLRGVKCLLIEQRDFGASTSYNSLRILHGGFRYLQHLDLQRLYESAGERRWYLEFFPELAAPLPCLMPLYGDGLRRPLFLRPALKAYDLLTARQNKNLPLHRRVPNGKLLNSSDTQDLCPYIRQAKLKGGALWYDGFMPDSQRILVGSLRWACEYGLTALNYVRATELVIENDRVAGVIARDEENGHDLQFSSTRVVNAAGPWCRQLASEFDRDEAALFRSMMAYNVLFDHPAISSTAVAVAPPGWSAHTYFIVPWKGRLLAGTGQAPWPYPHKDPMPSDDQLEAFCADLEDALPGISLDRSRILHVFTGLQSAKKEGGIDFCKREVIIDHAIKGGPRGFFSVSGIKFTTARKVAEKTIRVIFPLLGTRQPYPHRDSPPPSDATTRSGIYEFDWMPLKDDLTWERSIRNMARDESVIHLDDLILRRTSLGDNPNRALKIAAEICGLMSWDENRCLTEIDRLARHFAWAKITH